jgi:hypothetical protein
MGLAPERLKPGELRELNGLWAAFELYSPKTLPLRVIEALGATPAECEAALARRGLDPRKFEFVPLRAPF